jgi:hypothetical protein
MSVEQKCCPVLLSYVVFVLLAPVAQRIERWPPEPGARVRVPSGAVFVTGKFPLKTKTLDSRGVI